MCNRIFNLHKHVKQFGIYNDNSIVIIVLFLSWIIRLRSISSSLYTIIQWYGHTFYRKFLQHIYKFSFLKEEMFVKAVLTCTNYFLYVYQTLVQ